MGDFNWAELLHSIRKMLLYLVLLLLFWFSVFWYLGNDVILKIKADLLPSGATLIVTGPLEYAMTKMQVALVFGALAALPMFAALLARRLNVKLEKTSLVKWMLAALCFFVLGFYFTYEILLPIGINVLASSIVAAGITPAFSISQFVTFVVLTVVLFSAAFELPLIVSWLAVKGIVSLETLKGKRKHVYVGILIATAVMTADPTPLSQILLSVPLICLYELSIIFASIASARA